MAVRHFVRSSVVVPSSPAGLALVLAPVLLMFAAGVMMLVPRTLNLFLWLVGEDHPVEWMTFVLLIVGSAVSFRNAVSYRRLGAARAVVVFHAVLAAGLLVIGMEEVAWGQRWFGFETPPSLAELNVQHEVTLHNLRGLHGKSELMRLAFGLGGLIGMTLWRSPRLRSIAAPPALWSWFLVITLHAAVDTYNDVLPIGRRFDFAIARTSEVVEMLVAGAALLYAVCHARRVARNS